MVAFHEMLGHVSMNHGIQRPAFREHTHINVNQEVRDVINAATGCKNTARYLNTAGSTEYIRAATKPIR